MNITCVYAYPAEVEHFQRRIKKAKPLHNFTWVCWRYKTAAAVFELDKKSDLVVNLGFAGGLNGRLALGAVALVSEIVVLEKPGAVMVSVNSEYQKAALNFTQRQTIPTARLLSSRLPVVTSRRKKELAKLSGADLVDMEAYWLFQTAQRLNTPFISLKVVSDNASEAAFSQARQDKSKSSKILGETAYKIIKSIVR